MVHGPEGPGVARDEQAWRSGQDKVGLQKSYTAQCNVTLPHQVRCRGIVAPGPTLK